MGTDFAPKYATFTLAIPSLGGKVYEKKSEEYNQEYSGHFEERNDNENEKKLWKTTK